MGCPEHLADFRPPEGSRGGFVSRGGEFSDMSGVLPKLSSFHSKFVPRKGLTGDTNCRISKKLQGPSFTSQMLLFPNFVRIRWKEQTGNWLCEGRVFCYNAHFCCSQCCWADHSTSTLPHLLYWNALRLLPTRHQGKLLRNL